MTTRKKTTKATKTARTKKQNALDLLEQDHELVDSLFKKYERLGEGRGAEKKELLERICRELTVHAQIEEEIFYPECRDALAEKDEELLDEAAVEHGSVKALVSQLEGAEPGDELVDARVKVLSEYVKHHVKEEEDELFPKVKKSKSIDLESLGDRLMELKTELEGEGAPVHAMRGNNGRNGNGGGRGRRSSRLD